MTDWVQPAARPRGPPAPADRRAVRAGALRRHRRPVPQEGDAGDLRPRQPRPAAAGLQPDRLRPARLGRRGLRAGRARLGQGSTPARSSARRSGSSSPRASASCRATSTTTSPSTRCAAPSRSSTRCAAPAATTPSTSRSRRGSSATSSASSRSTGSPQPRRRLVAPGRRGEAVRPRPAVGARAQRHARRGLPVRLDLPDRPLPRQGDGPEHPGDALRQRDVRADLELQLRRPRADHDGRGHRHRRPGRLLRRHRRRPRRDPEPPDAADVAGRDGGAHVVRRRGPAHREAEAALGGQPARAAST